ncbi:MAG TPA: MFS transporter [Anaerolineae bacterium]|nr:MFS transporter [Anaerolineae bacterium]
MEEALAKKRRRQRWAWYLYDFGNSAYAAVILLAVYSAYFHGQVVVNAENASFLWGLSVGIAMLMVAFISPVLGAIADFSRAKKPFLFGFTLISCIFTAMLFFVQRGDVFIGMLYFILAEIGYRSAQVFYNALLPDIASHEEMGRVSGAGWAIGSAGGVICLFIILPLIMIFKGPLMVRISFLITAAYFALSSLPIFLWLKEGSAPTPLPKGETYLSVGFKRLISTFKKVRHFGGFIKFMICFLVYNDGVIMALNFASIIGAVLFGMEQQALIIFVILVQLTNVAGAYVFGLMADRMGGKRALMLSIAVMFVAIVMMFLAQSQGFFFFIGGLAGFAMAGIQSLSRTVVGMLVPSGQSAEFYGFFSVAGQASSFVGPTVYGWVATSVTTWQLKQGMEDLLARQQGQRMAILSIGVFLLVGLLLLGAVHENPVRKSAKLPVDGKNLAQAG